MLPLRPVSISPISCLIYNWRCFWSTSKRDQKFGINVSNFPYHYSGWWQWKVPSRLRATWDIRNFHLKKSYTYRTCFSSINAFEPQLIVLQGLEIEGRRLEGFWLACIASHLRAYMNLAMLHVEDLGTARTTLDTRCHLYRKEMQGTCRRSNFLGAKRAKYMRYGTYRPQCKHASSYT